jgi:hypothetical protein
MTLITLIRLICTGALPDSGDPVTIACDHSDSSWWAWWTGFGPWARTIRVYRRKGEGNGECGAQKIPRIRLALFPAPFSLGCFGLHRNVPTRDFDLHFAIMPGELSGFIIHGQKKRA